SGSNPIKPKFDGNCPPENVYTFEDILSERVTLENEHVAVIGSGMTGLETAHYLTEKGNTVTIVEMANEIAPGTWMQHKDDILPKLKKANTTFMTGKKLIAINNDSIVVADTKTKKQTSISTDTVVLSLGSRPNALVVSTLKEQGIDPIVIGDSKKVGRIADATKAAYQVAISIK
ncbi:MAG: NAD(P)/FAD-dependent oxidoreductase, partial [Clostridia bacterium]|nr:NAD(P)/FAD-dependent oxidoreductase [Clostridia bacterium]